jgi:peptidylprolyl isomerase
VSSRAKAAAAEAARRRKNRKRLGAALAAGVLVMAVVGAAAFTGGGGATSSTTTTTLNPFANETTTTEAALPSAAGLPCVAVSDPLPAGAPDVPVKVGPPPTDLVMEDLKEGNGAVVAETNTLSVNYIGVSCSTGKIFDSSYSRGQPANFALSEVIEGWKKGLPGMKVGGQRLLGIPAAMAYGANPPPSIAPDETLWFVVDVLSAT